ncbi:hypothetical protein BST79_gp289 [Only Syngen Nebraska virus 5]|uniref:hypothetical protein n=1 Tax=Only Syngen Nebraska virus 5 TaxID=1917232 RepID=UPI0009018CD5|nr:hypothetical protein BST79_gp289 [Only Syngen Nebraska virus 5]APC25802.1 hypothetical protein [Only Syngen Nebraska virus 5]
MKKRYIFGLVLLAMFALAGMGTVVYFNWSDIKDIFSDVTGVGKKKSLKTLDVSAAPLGQTAVVRVDVKEILDKPEDDPELKKDLGDIQKVKASTDAQINALTKTTVDTIKKESEVAKKKAPKLAAVVVDNAKKNEIKGQKNASSKYAEIIKQIEKEKMKASVFLTGNLTEKEKIAKINNIDMEVEIVDNFKTDPYFTLLRDPTSVKHVWTKQMAEDMVMKGKL